MNLKMRCNLWKEKESMTPDANFKIALKNKLDAAWAQKYPGKVSWLAAHRLQFAAAMTAVILICGMAGTGAYAYASADVTEGAALYPVKQKIENIEEKLQFTPEAKAKFYLKQIKRREAEAAVVKKKDDIEVRVLHLEEKIEQTENKLEKVNAAAERGVYRNEKLHEEVRARLQQRLEKRKELLQNQADKLDQRRERIINYLNNLNLNK